MTTKNKSAADTAASTQGAVAAASASTPEQRRQQTFDALGDRRVKVPTVEDLENEGTPVELRSRLIAQYQHLADEQVVNPYLTEEDFERLADEWEKAHPKKMPEGERDRALARTQFLEAKQTDNPNLTEAELAELGANWDVDYATAQSGAAPGEPAPEVEMNAAAVFELIREGFELLRVQTGHAKWPAWVAWEEKMLAVRAKIASGE